MMKKILLFSLAVSFAQAQSTLPSSYDLRAEGLAPGVQNQKESSICWAVASCTAIESNLAKKGIISLSPTGELHASPWHMAANTGAPKSLIYNEVVKDGEVISAGYEFADGTGGGWGGDGFACNLGYLTRGRLESGERWAIPGATPGLTTTFTEGGVVSLQGEPSNQIPFDTWASHNPMTEQDMPAANQPVAFLCRGLYTIKNDDPAAQVQAVKEALTNYGAVTTGIYVTQDVEFVESADGTSYYYNFSPAEGNPGEEDHEVTIIGWDDNYVTATGTGAWIIQNSWGEAASGKDGEDGCGVFYVSYNDLNVGKSATAFNMEAAGKYSDFVVQNDPVMINFDTMQDDEDFMISVNGYKAASILDLEGGTLGALGLFGDKDQVLNVNLYLAAGWGNGGNWDTDQLELLYGFDVQFAEKGYSLFDLNQYINLEEGGMLLVMIDYGLSLSKIEYVPLNSLMQSSDYEGLSYYFDGTDWIDTATAQQGGMYFIKGYVLAEVPEPSSSLLMLLGYCFVCIRRRR